ncbi:Copper amine oxidase N-terminal domain-containing protein [Desulfotomaculum arcticum]|uniref:Copper amine oxidase N-terminal domain-containing protein n=1 Tax=Desulfotruncus arcticus DSM 17038 TaxID=1121424 RepID=A0A1I2YUF1_9FIRM|nr:copper amine oxidase N-terminal domain-containing protein [Desulfotruncus arcticus]SFH29234.1 Copper amine oxidase N-terminal domain-containing protein [Desulfotomaculum arcticum] [Desulfotruncus arcticus DSM 17038]
MKKKFFVIISLVLVMLSASLPAFAANDMKLQVNDDLVPSPGISMINGSSMIPVDIYAAFSGADVQWESENDFVIKENDTTMKLTVGKKEAMLADKSLMLTAEPTKAGDKVLIPLRSVSNAFGFEVGLVNDQGMTTLKRSETRDGMTVSDVLAKSTAAVQEFNTYSMDGQFNINMNIAADGKIDETAPQNITSKLTGQMQNDPFQIYMKQTLAPVDGETVQPMDVETYMTQEKMYIKAPGQDWLVQDMPFSPEFWKQQQDIQSDPLKAAEQMKEMGILLNFGNDVTVNDQEYYVVNATLDMEKFKEGYQKIIQQATQALPQESNDTADLQQQMQKLFETAKLDYNYSVLINKETFITDIINFDARLEMLLDNPAPAKAEGEQNDSQPQQVKIDMKYSGNINITEPGGSFTAPDVSTAVEMKMPQQLTPND